MIVVSDTSPINYLILIDVERVLPSLFQQVRIPEQVFQELSSSKAPKKVSDWIANPPDWLTVETVAVGSEMAHLDQGEAAAISLAETLSADLILLDEANGRREARRRGIALTGAIGVLDRAASRGLIDLTEAIDRLQRTNFRVSPRLLKAVQPPSDGGV